MSHPEDSDECDYCRDTGTYEINGDSQVCFCVVEQRDALQAKLTRLIEAAERFAESETTIRELRAAIAEAKKP